MLVVEMAGSSNDEWVAGDEDGSGSESSWEADEEDPHQPLVDEDEDEVFDGWFDSEEVDANPKAKARKDYHELVGKLEAESRLGGR